MDSIEKRLALLDKKASATSNSQSTSAVPTSFPTTTTILRVITHEIVMPSKKEKSEPSFVNEFKAILFPNSCGYSRPVKDSSSIYFPPARPARMSISFWAKKLRATRILQTWL